MWLWWTSLALASSTSSLWGTDGELFDPLGRLPDYSWAGYHGNDEEPPELPAVADVADFGATADDDSDDTAAFQAAIAAAVAAGGGAVTIGPGTFVLSDVLLVESSSVALRGAGSELTVLSFSVSLEDVQGEREQWSWEGGLLWFTGGGEGSPLTSVTQEAERGATSLTVADASVLSVGELVVLERTDDDEGTLGWHLHAEQREGGDCSYQDPIVLDWPVEIAAIDGDVVTLGQPLRLDVREAWAPELEDTNSWIRDVGVEGLTIAFPDVEYAGHLKEPGYNGIFFDDGVVDAWVRDVVIHNSDSGVLTGSHAKWILVEDLALTGRGGHHGFNIAFTHDLRATDFVIDADFVHAITVDHRTSGSVFHRGSGSVDFELDHHKDSPHENLFTAIDANVNFLSGGSTCAGPASGARETFWLADTPIYPPPWDDVQINSVGMVEAATSLTEDQQWNEPVEDLWPRDLFRAQLAWRRGEVLQDTGLDTADTDTRDRPQGESPDRCGCAGAAQADGSWLLLLLPGLLRRRRTRVAS